MSGYLPDGCTQEDCDRAVGGYDEGYYCSWCEERVDDEHECPGADPVRYGPDESDPPMHVSTVRRQTAEPGECAYCDQCVAAGETMFPSHDAYHGCESVKRNHCTCDMCF